MAQTVLILRSTTTPLTSGVSTLAYGKQAITFISGVKRYYIGDNNNLAQEIGGDAYALLNSPAFTGTPTAPTASANDNSTKIATTAFVQTLIQASQAGLILKGAVTATTTTTLPAYTYDNGTSGVGATITADANGALPDQDGITLSNGDLLLVKNETSGNAPYNGIYVVTQIGDGSNPFILTRATNFNSASNILPNSFVFVSKGSTLSDTGWTLIMDGTAVVGTTDLVFTQFSAAGTITAGNGLTKSGNTISALSDTVGGANLARAVNVSTNGLAVKIDDQSIIENGSQRLAVKPDSTTGATVVPVVISANGVGTTLDNSSIIHTAGVLSVNVVDGGTF